MQHQGFHMPPLVFLTEIHQKQHFSITAAHQTPEGNPKQLETKNPQSLPTQPPHPPVFTFPYIQAKTKGKIYKKQFICFFQSIFMATKHTELQSLVVLGFVF